MNRTQVKTRLSQYKEIIDQVLLTSLPKGRTPKRLYDSMQYSLQAGGKRIRPVLCLVWAELFGLSGKGVQEFSAALELIHTYSLIHDDLPAMDNDDFRRGKPTNHVQFDEATAILAGDALLTQAFSLMLGAEIDSDRLLPAVSRIAWAAGPEGMVGGQVLDMQLTGSNSLDLNELTQMHSLKTGALIQSACYAGACLAGADENELEKVLSYGSFIGLAFQVADDVLDLTGDSEKMGKAVGKDQMGGKITYPGLLGLHKSKEMGQELVTNAKSCLENFKGEQKEFLSGLAEYIMSRTE